MQVASIYGYCLVNIFRIHQMYYGLKFSIEFVFSLKMQINIQFSSILNNSTHFR